jgi:hypothetical protein
MHGRGRDLPVRVDGAGQPVIGEYGVRANEYLVGQLDAAIHRNVVLDLDPVANPNRLVHEDVLS